MRPLPLIALKLRVTNLPAEEAIHTLTLRCQVQIQTSQKALRSPGAGEAARPLWHTG